MKHRLTRRLAIYFSVTLLVFALVIGAMFSFLFRRYTTELHTKDLRAHAETIAAALSEREICGNPASIAENSPNASPMPQEMHRGRRRGMMRHGGQESHDIPKQNAASPHSPMEGTHTYCRRRVAPDTPIQAADGNERGLGTLLRQLNAFTGSEVWLVDRATHTITLSGTEAETDYPNLPPAAATLLESVFAGGIVSGETFSELTSAPSVTVGAPVRDASGNVIGAVLMHRRLSDIHASEAEGFRILVASLALAFLLAAALALLLARRFIRPLAAMEKTAAALADGAYDSRSGIRQDDEIGSLAQSLDTLAERLEIAAGEREKLDAMRRDFFASISHELRTPLTVLRGSLDVLASGLVQDEEKRRGYLEQMENNANHLTRLVNDIFDLARLENPDFSIEKTDMDLSDALRDAVRTARRLAAPKSIALSFEDAPPIPIRGDYGRLRQMFLVVLDNAVKFSPEGASVDIETAVSNGSWRIAVRDSGPGIDADLLPHIFDRFRTGRVGGTGLGLSIAQGIARRHDIVIEAENTNGGGARFSFRGHMLANSDHPSPTSL